MIKSVQDEPLLKRVTIEGDSGREYTVTIDTQELKAWCDCPSYVYRKTCKHVFYVISNLDLKAERWMPMEYLKTSCKALDDLQIFPYGTVVSITSEPNLGKTKLGLQLSLASIKQTGKSAVIIETEGEAVEDQMEILKRFAPRYNLEPEEALQKVKFITTLGDVKEYGIQKLMKLLGYDLKLQLSDNGKFSCDFRPHELIIKDYLQDCRYLLIDSITMPIKESVGNETQNLPARAAIIQRLYGRLYQLAKTYNLLVVVNHHLSVNPMPIGHAKDLGTIYGGYPVLYNSKYVLQILSGTSALKKKYPQAEQIRRLRLLRHPFKMPSDDYVPVQLKKDFGFADL